MLQRAHSPVFVGRQAEVLQLEDALLSANRGDGRLVLLAKAELALPYLPFVEALGNHLGEWDGGVIRAELGGADRA